ncbi:MAG TPA: hypothetical protein VGX37_04100 [Allosphingosinicella sp.]|jgi:protein-S-isoprenylcysteine O-methyltransferase Ste14|nr:hypothetical protein [Allosphingosinicella sp.]
MGVSTVERADRNSRSRGWCMAIGAVVLLVLSGFSAWGIPHGTTDLPRAITWLVLTLLWLGILATGGGLMLGRQVRRLMNDEVSTQNRRRALETGFWVAMMAAVVLYFASLAEPIGVRSALAMLTELAIATSLLRYAWLELR